MIHLTTMAALLTQVAAQMIILYPLAGVDGAEELAAFALCTRTHIMSLEGSIVHCRLPDAQMLQFIANLLAQSLTAAFALPQALCSSLTGPLLTRINLFPAHLCK